MVAVITDYGFGDPAAIRYSLAIFSGLIASLAIVILMWGAAAYRERAVQMRAERTAI
jgi:hypothetical protein